MWVGEKGEDDRALVVRRRLAYLLRPISSTTSFTLPPPPPPPPSNATNLSRELLFEALKFANALLRDGNTGVQKKVRSTNRECTGSSLLCVRVRST